MEITRKRVIASTTALALCNVLAQLVNLIVIPVLVGVFGDELFGIWILSNVLVGYSNILDFGLLEGLQRDLAEARVQGDTDRVGRIETTALLLLLGLGAGLGALMYLPRHAIVEFLRIGEANAGAAVQLIAISGVSCLLLWPIKLGVVVFNAYYRIQELSVLLAATTLAQGVATLLWVGVSRDIVLLKIVVTAVMLLGYGVILVRSRRFLPAARRRWRCCSAGEFGRIARFSFSMFYVNFVALLMSQIDTLIVARLGSVAAVTKYAVAVKLPTIIQQGSALLSGAMVPTVYNLRALGEQGKLERLVHKASRYRLLVVAPVAALGALVSGPFIRLWMGPAYADCAFWSSVMCCVPILTSFAPATTAARAAGRGMAVNAVYTAQALVKLVIALMLTRQLGFAGPILGNCVAVLLLGDLVLFPVSCRLLGIGWKRVLASSVRIILACAAATAVFLPLAGWPGWGRGWPALALFCALFLGASYLWLALWFLRGEERRDLSAAVDLIRVGRR